MKPISQKQVKKLKNKKQKRQIPRILILIIFAVVIFGAYEILHNVGLDLIKAPRHVSDELVTDLQQDNVNAIYSLFPPGAFNSSNNSALVHSVSVDSSFLQGTANLSSGLKYSSGKAVMIYQIKKSNGSVVFLKVILEEHPVKNGQWMITNFQPSDFKPGLNLNLSG